VSILEIIVVLSLFLVGVKYFKINAFIFFACFFLWLFSYYFTFPAAISDLNTGYLAASSLENDKDDLKLREWNLSKKLIDKKISSSLEARAWLESRKNALALVTGNEAWLDLFFRDSYQSLSNLDTKIDSIEVNKNIIKDKKTNLKFIFLPKKIKIPFYPYELSSSLIENIVKSIEIKEFNSIKKELRYRIIQARKARSVYGHWKSGLPRSLGFFLESNFLLLDILISNNLSTNVKACEQIHKTYQAAASLAKNSRSELSSLVYNNAAVAKKICGLESAKLFDLAISSTQNDDIKKLIKENLSK